MLGDRGSINGDLVGNKVSIIGDLVGVLVGIFDGRFVEVGMLVYESPIDPPPHPQHASVANFPSVPIYELPWTSHLLPIAYHSQLKMTPSPSFHPIGKSRHCGEGGTLGGGVTTAVEPPPHAQHAIFAVTSSRGYRPPNDSQRLYFAYHAQLNAWPSLSYQSMGVSTQEEVGDRDGFVDIGAFVGVTVGGVRGDDVGNAVVGETVEGAGVVGDIVLGGKLSRDPPPHAQHASIAYLPSVPI